MTNVTVIGSQWGDEGKGKIVDWLAGAQDIIVRFQGGHNAGHTLVIDKKVYKLHLLPSGVVREGKLSIIGNGVVIDPTALLAEIDEIRAQGISITPQSLMISEHAPIIIPFHSVLDRSRENKDGAQKIGTTGRGIGPAYEDKVGRRALRMCDLAHPETLRDKLQRIAAYHNALHKGADIALFDADEFATHLLEMAPRLLPFIGPTWKVLSDARKKNRRILFEGAQGVMLDVDHGTYPFVTSSNTIAPQAATGSGVGADQLGFVLGITKAYSTRVGSGPFPTELHDEVGEHLTQRGHEYGTTTGRKRRCGWFDAVQVRQSVALSGIKGLALMKLDVMDELAEIKICVGYSFQGKTYDYIPAAAEIQAGLTAVYETMAGWQEPLAGIRDLNRLPAKALAYIRRIEELTETPVVIVSTSPERDDTIMVMDILQHPLPCGTGSLKMAV